MLRIVAFVAFVAVVAVVMVVSVSESCSNGSDASDSLSFRLFKVKLWFWLPRLLLNPGLYVEKGFG